MAKNCSRKAEREEAAARTTEVAFDAIQEERRVMLDRIERLRAMRLAQPGKRAQTGG